MAGYLTYEIVILLLLFSHYAVSNSLQPHGLQHAILTCPSQSPRACSNSCPFSQRCHPTISSSVIPEDDIRVFSNESTLCIRWPKDWSFLFSISLSSEYSGLVSLMNWFPTLGFQRADWFHSGFLFWFSLPSQLLLTTFQLLFWTTVTRSNPRNSDTERNESSPSCWDNLRQCRNVTIHGPKNKLFCVVANQSSHSQHMCLKENRKWTQRISQHV